MKTIIEIPFKGKILKVEKLPSGEYQVKLNEEVKHPDLSAEDVMRVMAHYLQSHQK